MDKDSEANETNNKEKEQNSGICLQRIISQLELNNQKTIDLNETIQEIFKPTKEEGLGKSNQKNTENGVEQHETVIEGFLLAIEIKNKKIVSASEQISKFLNYNENELLDKKVDDIINSRSENYFAKAFSQPVNSCKDSKPIESFTCQFLKKKDENNNTKDCDIVELKCLCVCTNLKPSMKFQSENKDVNGRYCICLATPCKKVSTDLSANKVSTRGPPNQTINTRTEIPQPETFKTRHDVISGKIIAIENYNKLAGTTKEEKNELIRRCIITLYDVRSNGISLAQSLIRQALGVGQATTPAYKFMLADGRWVTAQSKSKLINQTGEKGKPSFILSTHFIYRDGSLQGLSKISPSMRNILTAPVVSNSSSTFSSTNTVTTATVRTSSYPNFSAISNAVSFSETLNCLPSWSGGEQFRTRNSVDVARELLASTGADHNNAEELANSVLSPPPHLDGHLVHAIGGNKTKSLSSTPSTSKEDNSSSSDNLATFPGPPCVDLSNFKFPNQNGSLVLTPSMFVNGITTMRIEATIATSTEPILTSLPDSLESSMVTSFDDFEKSDVKIEKVLTEGFGKTPSITDINSAPNIPFVAKTPTSIQKRVFTPPEDKSFSAPISPVVTRPRSASTNNSVMPVSKSLKRSASTSLQDCGIVTKSKVKPIQPRRKSKDAKSKTTAPKDTILSQLLKCKELPEEIVSTALGTLASKQPRPLAKSYSVKSDMGSLLQNRIFPATDINMNHITTSIHLTPTQTPLSNSFGGGVNSSVSSIFNNNTPASILPNSGEITPLSGGANSHLPSFSEATSVSKEELDELDDIINDLVNSPDIFPPAFNENSNLNQTPFNNQQQNTTNILANILDNNNNNEGSAYPQKNYHSDPMLGVQVPASTMNPLYFTSSPQNVSMINQTPSPQNMIGQPNFNTSPNNRGFINNASPQMFVGGGVSPVIEQCPNKTITQTGAMSPRVPPSNLPMIGNTGSSPLYRDINGHESWGKEPLVDLGSIPPPHGVNPRLPIPNFNVRRNGVAEKLLREQQVRQADLSYPSFGPIPVNNNNILSSPTMPNMMPSNEMMTSPNPRVNGGPGYGMPGNIRHQTYDIRTGMQAISNGGGSIRNTQDLRHQLHLRLHQPNSFEGDLQRARPAGNSPFPVSNVRPRTDMTSSGILAQQKNEYYIKQQKLMEQQRMEVSPAMPSGGRDGIFMSGPQNIVRIHNQFQRQNSYSPRQQFSPPVGALHQVRPQMMTSYNPGMLRQNSAPNYPGGGGSPQSPMIVPNFGKNLSSPTFNSPPSIMTSQSLGDKTLLGKSTPPKRNRAKKPRKNAKSKSTLNLAKDWNGGVGNIGPGLSGLYSHGGNDSSKVKPVMQMMLGNIHQRPQATFTSGGFVQGNQMTSSSPMIMTSPNNGNGQTINLNMMMDQQNQQRQINIPASSFLKSPPGGISDSFTSPNASLSWSEVNNTLDIGMELNTLPPTLDSNLNQNSIALTNGNNNLSFGFGDVALNSNTNNNNPPGCRYTASMTSSPIPVNDVESMTSQASPMKRTGQRKTSLLETLLLS